MNKEDKELLLKDLCARLPHKCRVFYEYIDDLDNKTYGYSLTLNTWCIDEFIANKAVVKPYLRPMSSMTEEEERDWWTYKQVGTKWEEQDSHSIDWLNKNMFDYRGLIEKDLAIAVTKENNPYEKIS